MSVGNILQALEESGAADDTIILFVADHGRPLPFISCHYLADAGVAAAFERYPKTGSGRAFAAKRRR